MAFFYELRRPLDVLSNYTPVNKYICPSRSFDVRDLNGADPKRKRVTTR